MAIYFLKQQTGVKLYALFYEQKLYLHEAEVDE